jgi:hypothetical protein
MKNSTRKWNNWQANGSSTSNEARSQKQYLTQKPSFYSDPKYLTPNISSLAKLKIEALF